MSQDTESDAQANARGQTERSNDGKDNVNETESAREAGSESPESTEAESREETVGPTGDPGDPRVGEGLLDASMGPSSAFAHLYRGELHRMKLWRERLDRTTNWAVILLAAVLTWAFTSTSNPHYVILVGNLAVGLFLVIEARRYRAYDVWRSRVRTIQQHVWARGLDPERPLTDANWRRDLAEDYDQPTLKITAEEAIAHRLRRVYLPLFAILNGAWVLRVTAFTAEPWPASAAIGMIPGLVVAGAVGVAMLAASVVALRPRTWYSTGELRTEDLRSR
ncbi:DUF2270 domain-containing protein [Halobaculum limi]|uniref:DUF2270 domain-containing protein n=1 Tax=Halobaculum limi TaxID=3031916 RepID=UPI002404B195|nr:DUF2270 domain-containing protein [Halobaculum sp. YSMS11]